MISLKQINDQRVKKIHIPKQDNRPIKGFDICEEVFANIFLCARKKSGKTSALFKIMKECVVRKTVIYIFCSTIYKDPNWIEIRKYFEKKGMDIRVFTSIYDDGEDQLFKLINDLSEEAKEKEEREEDERHGEEEEIGTNTSKVDDMFVRLEQMYKYSSGLEPYPIIKEQEYVPDDKKKRKESKYQAPEYMIIFDDLSNELKSRSLVSLLKFNRHFKSKIIISSQWLHDLLPDSRKQIDLFLIFKGFPEKKMELIYKDCDSAIPFELFYQIYKKSTKRRFSFMYIDTRSDSFRCNFDRQFVIKDDSDSDEN